MELKTITEIKSNDGVNIRMEEAEERISEVEDNINLNRKKITMDGIVLTIPQPLIHVEALINVTVFRDRVCRR